MLAHRIALHPRLSQVITTPWNPLAGQRWTASADFDLDAHIHRTALAAPGGPQERWPLTSAAWSAGRSIFGRPLWEVHVVDGPGRGGALVTRFHHSLGDGQAMVRMLLSLDGRLGRRLEHPLRPSRRAAGGARRDLDPHLPDMPALVRQGVSSGGDPCPPDSVRPRSADLAPRRPLPAQGCRLERAAAAGPWSRGSRQSSGTTVNDVVVSVIAGALGNYLRKGERTRAASGIRAMVPVNMRAAGRHGDVTGNRFSLVFLELPIGVTDARERLMKVKIEMDRIKRSYGAGGGLVAGAIPGPSTRSSSSRWLSTSTRARRALCSPT